MINVHNTETESHTIREPPRPGSDERECPYPMLARRWTELLRAGTLLTWVLTCDPGKHVDWPGHASLEECVSHWRVHGDLRGEKELELVAVDVMAWPNLGGKYFYWMWHKWMLMSQPTDLSSYFLDVAPLKYVVTQLLHVALFFTTWLLWRHIIHTLCILCTTPPRTDVHGQEITTKAQKRVQNIPNPRLKEQ